MATFALITEGRTDQVILGKIIEELCEEFFEDGVFINDLQPIRDNSDAKHAPHAGWELVFEYCKQSIESALATNDYVVIQLDTDCGDQKNFGLDLTIGGKDRPYMDLIEGAKDAIINRIGQELFQANIPRFIFAISVHSIESWILLYNYGLNHTKNGFRRLYRERQRREKIKHKKEVECYMSIAKGIRLRELTPFLEHDSSFGHFLRSLIDTKPSSAEEEPDSALSSKLN